MANITATREKRLARNQAMRETNQRIDSENAKRPFRPMTGYAMTPTPTRKAARMTSDREAQSGNWWSYMGYSCTVEHGISYACPALKLRGYANDLQLHRAIKRAVAKRVKAETNGR